MAWSKFSPDEPPRPAFEATSASAARRTWILRWGWWLSQAMVVVGLALILYWGFWH